MKANWLAFTCLLLALCISNAVAKPADDDRLSKLALFNIVRFDNDVCTSNNRNGTCYTTSECSSRGGTAGTSCGGGFGVCCTIVLSCGNSTSDNNTYLEQTAITSLSDTCTYTICKSDTLICRIKFDFQTLTLAGAVAGTAVVEGADAPAAQQTNGASIGDCSTDTFNINSNGGGASPPQICGTNSGQHMIVDASDNCHTVNINVGASDSATSRSWTIVVSQYTCGEENVAGPMGCLQWHTGTTGRIANFGVATSTTAAAYDEAQTHLSSQNYNICIRRTDGYCYICYIATVNPGTAAATAHQIQATFGLSLSGDAAAKSVVGTSCSTDYITIPGGQTLASAMTATVVLGATGTNNQYCGRALNTDSIALPTINDVSVCTRNVPFTVGVYYDSDEVTGTTQAQTNEQVAGPAGIVGFDLKYAQGDTNC